MKLCVRRIERRLLMAINITYNCDRCGCPGVGQEEPINRGGKVGLPKGWRAAHDPRNLEAPVWDPTNSRQNSYLKEIDLCPPCVEHLTRAVETARGAFKEIIQDAWEIAPVRIERDEVMRRKERDRAVSD